MPNHPFGVHLFVPMQWWIYTFRLLILIGKCPCYLMSSLSRERFASNTDILRLLYPCDGHKSALDVWYCLCSNRCRVGVRFVKFSTFVGLRWSFSYTLLYGKRCLGNCGTTTSQTGVRFVKYSSFVALRCSLEDNNQARHRVLWNSKERGSRGETQEEESARSPQPSCSRFPVSSVRRNVPVTDRLTQPPEGVPLEPPFPVIFGLEESANIIVIIIIITSRTLLDETPTMKIPEPNETTANRPAFANLGAISILVICNQTHLSIVSVR